MSNELIQKAEKILKSVEIPERHSFFQIEKFMIGSQPTGQSQLWQIVKEIKARMENVESLTLQIEDTKDTVDELGIKANMAFNDNTNQPKTGHNDDLTVALRKIEIKKLNRLKQSAQSSIEKLEKKVKYIMEEVNCLVSGFEALTERVGQIKAWDDPQAQKEMWNEKFLEEFNLRVILKRPLDTDLVKNILALDDDAPVKRNIVGLIEKIQQQMIIEQTRPRIEQNAQIQR